MPVRPARLAALLAALVVALPACDTEIPPISSDGRVYTMWGQLDPTADRQAIRVDPISATIDGVETFEGSVVSVDLDTGAETAWRDSVIQFADGSTGHVFLADYRPDYDSRVEVRVVRDGEVASYARVTVPPRVTGTFGALVSGVRNELDLVLPGAPRVVGARVVYDIQGGILGYVESIPIPDQQITSVEFGWRVRIDFSNQIEVLRRRFRERDITQFNSSGIRVVVAVANEEWAAPYPFSFSRDLLIQPGTVSNVRGGYGFVGAAYTLDLEWQATPEEIQRLGL